MAELSGRSAGVSVREIDLTGPRNAAPTGIPAGVIGTADQGPAFVPITFASLADFMTLFGQSDGTKFGPIAVSEWLRNASAVTYLRVLGVGTGQKRTSGDPNAGSVTAAGFVVGDRLPLDDGLLGDNPYANVGGPLGRLYFLGCYMSESLGSTVFSSAGIQTAGTNVAAPIIRGVIMAPSGVVPTLSSSYSLSVAPTAATVATSAGPNGTITGSVNLSLGGQSFVLMLNGHKGTDAAFPNVITASFDQTAPNYFGNILNTNPYEMQEAGHLLYVRYDIHPSQAFVTGVGILTTASNPTLEPIAFLTTGSQARNVGTTTVPSYENFQDRFTTPASPTIISQKFGGKYLDLFRVLTLSDGAVANSRYKLSIENIAVSSIDNRSFGTFDLLVRDFNDTDDNRIVLESFTGLTLDPTSNNYIARRVGDLHTFYDFDRNPGSQKIVVDGRYPNVSNLVRVSMDVAVENGAVDPTALPIGFRGPAHLVTSGSDPLTAVASDARLLTTTGAAGLKRAVQPPVPFRDNIALGQDPKRTANRQLYWGVQFEQKVSLIEPNVSRVADKTVRSLTRFFPSFQVDWQDVIVGENSGVPDVNGTVLDSDRFNNNLFSLDRIRIVTGSNGLIDVKQVVSATYVRDGKIDVNDAAKTRALNTAIDFADVTTRTYAKFSLFVQGGFDGTLIFDQEADTLTNQAIEGEMEDPVRGQGSGPTVSSYNAGLAIMANTSDVDIKLLAIPGIRHGIVTNRVIDAIENDRFDALYIMDIEEYDTLDAVVTSSLQDVNVRNTATNFGLRGLDSSFASVYFPNVIMQNPFTNLPTEVPPSVVVLGAFALNDAVAFPWFAPAGFTRGALQTTEAAAVLLNRTNMDVLQGAGINPVVSFAGSDGVVVWGQKTLQAAASALDRVNVRRLLIDIRRQVRQIANTMLFEPNRETTLQRFSALVNPVLQRVQEQQGLNRFLVAIDTTTTTQADVENNLIRGKIFLEPTRTAEIVSIDFVLTNAGATVT